jgi:hypothetical protein
MSDPTQHGPKPEFYECPSCGAFHPGEFMGDCRDDNSRFDLDELNSAFGATGWTEVDMIPPDPLPNLTAAAPDLLAAAKAVLDWCEHTGGWDAPCWTALELAILKAEGAPRDR